MLEELTASACFLVVSKGLSSSGSARRNHRVLDLGVVNVTALWRCLEWEVEGRAGEG